MVLKEQLVIFDRYYDLVYLKTFDKRIEAQKHYETIKNKYPKNNFRVYYTSSKFRSY